MRFPREPSAGVSNATARELKLKRGRRRGAEPPTSSSRKSFDVVGTSTRLDSPSASHSASFRRAFVRATPPGSANGHEAHGTGPVAAADGGPQEVVYVCPMHPEVTCNAPGICPKCNMKLVPKK